MIRALRAPVITLAGEGMGATAAVPFANLSRSIGRRIACCAHWRSFWVCFFSVKPPPPSPALVSILASGGPDPDLERLCDGVAPNAPLLFVPAAVGIVANLDLLAVFWVQVATAVVLGTAAALLVVGLCAQAPLWSERTTA